MIGHYQYQSGLPSQAIGNGATRVLLAMLGFGRPTVREVGERAGLRSTSTVHEHLKHLRRLGLVGWEDDHRGTLRAAVRVVPNIGTVPVHEEWWG